MPNFIYDLPNGLLYLLISAILTSTGLIGLFFIYKFVPPTIRRKDNSEISWFAVAVSVAYAVLMGLISVGVVANFDKTSDIIQNEATIVANLYRNADYLEDPFRSEIQSLIKKYLTTTIDQEWPFLHQGLITKAGYSVIDELSRSLKNYKSTNSAETFKIEILHQELNELYMEHKKRDNMNDSIVNLDVWMVIGIVTFLLIGVHCLFEMNPYLHMVLMTTLCLSMSALIFLVIALDYPFRGSISATAEPLQNALDYIEKGKLLSLR